MNEDMLNVMGSFISTELDAFENLHKELEEKDKEIYRLNNIIKEADKRIYECNNTIREAREYCRNDNNFQIVEPYAQSMVKGIQRELLEMLDKSGIDKELEHNKNFYSLEEVERCLEASKDFQDGEEIYYFIGALRYVYDENKRLNNIIKRYDYCLKKELEKVYSDTFIKWKIRELKGSDEE